MANLQLNSDTNGSLLKQIKTLPKLVVYRRHSSLFHNKIFIFGHHDWHPIELFIGKVEEISSFAIRRKDRETKKRESSNYKLVLYQLFIKEFIYYK